VARGGSPVSGTGSFYSARGIGLQVSGGAVPQARLFCEEALQARFFVEKLRCRQKNFV